MVQGKALGGAKDMMLINMDLLFGTDYQGLKRFEALCDNEKKEIRNKVILTLAKNIIGDYDNISDRQIKAAKLIQDAIRSKKLDVVDVEINWKKFEETDWNSSESIARCLKHFTTSFYSDDENIDKWLLSPYIVNIKGVNVF